MGVHTRFWIPFCVFFFFFFFPIPHFLLHYISFSRVYEPGTGSSSGARGFPFFQSSFFVVFIVGLGYGIFYSMGD